MKIKNDKIERTQRDRAIEASKCREDGFVYRPGQDGVIICGCEQDFSGELTIPEKLGGQRVFRIEDAFRNCEGLQRLVIPACVAEVAANIFGFCPSLQAITVAEENPDLCSVDGVLFSRDMTRLIQYPQSKPGAYTVPSGVKAIQPAAFAHSQELTSICLPDSVAAIGCHAFIMCERLSGATLPSGLKKLDYSIFSDCISLVEIKIPDSIVTIENGAFESCKSLTHVALPDRLRRIGCSAFYGCVSLEDISIPAATVEIDDGAFARCMSLGTIDVDAGNPVFHSKDGVLFDRVETELVQYPAGRVGDYTVPEGTRAIRNRAFSDCTRLTGVTIPDTVSPHIGGYAFWSCERLTSVTLPGSLQTICEGIFAQCVNLREVRLPASLAQSAHLAFIGCNSIKRLMFETQSPRITPVTRCEVHTKGTF